MNTGGLKGGQRVGGEQGTGRRARVHEGPIPQSEVEQATFGFAEPKWFSAAAGTLGGGLLFLAGSPGSGRRTAALNLLLRHCRDAGSLRALDSTTVLDRWRPSRSGGYLMEGLLPDRLTAGLLGHLRSLLREAEAVMVIVLPDDPELLRGLGKNLHLRPVDCQPPPPESVFEARFEAEVPPPAERERLLSALEPGLLDELLVPSLMPAEVVELVAAVVAADGDRAALGDLRERLSYRAEDEVPELIRTLREDAYGLAFLLAVCVFEGLDQRVVREEADRLLELADGRLTARIPAKEGDEGGQEERDNPAFVFRRSLTDLLRAVGAKPGAREIRTDGGYAHVVEAVTFIRHQQAEAVLRHVWREYGPLSDLLVGWLADVDGRRTELTQPVGRVMGLAARWGGGRQALEHIGKLAASERGSSRRIAAHALGLAAEDPVLATEVWHRLSMWSRRRDPYLRATVAHACGDTFGQSRPEAALRLLGEVAFGTGSGAEDAVVSAAVGTALAQLFYAGEEQRVFEQLARWAADPPNGAASLLAVFPALLASPRWFQRELAARTETSERIVDMVRASLNSAETFDATSRVLLRWCSDARWDEDLTCAVEHLVHALANPLDHGAFRFFVDLDRDDQSGTSRLVGQDIAQKALTRWRRGRTQA
ncbi:hypothetical protein HPT28_00925 [Streptomyces sp. JJ38]|nr:hypothetical protein [Streptomyces sp. JJ38]